MKKHAKQSIELDHLNLAPEAKTEVSNLIQSLLAQAQNERKLLEAKNQALTLELAHLRHIRYGAKSEALSRPQLSLFEEDWQTDVSAIEAEIEQLPLPVPQKTTRARAGRQPPTANRQPPTANRQPPTANRQPPTAAGSSAAHRPPP